MTKTWRNKDRKQHSVWGIRTQYLLNPTLRPCPIVIENNAIVNLKCMYTCRPRATASPSVVAEAVTVYKTQQVPNRRLSFAPSDRQCSHSSHKRVIIQLRIRAHSAVSVSSAAGVELPVPTRPCLLLSGNSPAVGSQSLTHALTHSLPSSFIEIPFSAQRSTT